MGSLGLNVALGGFVRSVRVVFGWEVGGFVKLVRAVFGAEITSLCRWAGVSDEDGFVRRMEWIWRLGAAGFGTRGNEGPCWGLAMSAVGG